MKRIFSITALVPIILLSSCTLNRYIYTASPPNNPYFTEKGQFKLNAYYSTNGAEYKDGNSQRADPRTRDNGTDIQAAYAFGKNWALTAGYYHRNETDFETENSGDLVIKYKRDLFDVGGGFFFPLNERKTFTFNAYTGIAFGKFAFTDVNQAANIIRFHDASITKWYLQPAFNYLGSQYVNIGFILKTSMVNYGNIRTNYSEVEKQSYGLDLVEKRVAWFFEPALNLQLGLPQLPWVRLDAAISAASPLRNDISLKESVRQNNVSIGLSFDISKPGKKSK